MILNVVDATLHPDLHPWNIVHFEDGTFTAQGNACPSASVGPCHGGMNVGHHTFTLIPDPPAASLDQCHMPRAPILALPLMRGWDAGIYDQSRLAPYAATTVTTHLTPDKSGHIIHKFSAMHYLEAGYSIATTVSYCHISPTTSRPGIVKLLQYCHLSPGLQSRQ
jgi:hypothetical protein